MIAKYKNNEVHAKCVEYSNDENKYDKSPEGLSLQYIAFDWEFTLSDGTNTTYQFMYGPLIRMNKIFGSSMCSEIFIPMRDVEITKNDGTKERIISAGEVYARCKKPTTAESHYTWTDVETEWTPWRRLAFADEIPKATCPFPIGFSFMLTTVYTDATISDLKAAYPGTSWGYSQVAGLYNTNVIRRTK